MNINKWKLRYDFVHFTDEELLSVLRDKDEKKVIEELNKLLVIKLKEDTSILERFLRKYENSDDVDKLKALCNFFHKIKIDVDVDFILKVMSESKLISDIVNRIAINNLEEIRNGNLYDIFSVNDSERDFYSFFEVYISANNIDVHIDVNLDEYYNSDNMVNSYVNSLPKDLLSKDETLALLIKAQNGSKEAVEKLALYNGRLVVSFSNRYLNKEVEQMDLIQEGNIGLIKAISKFNINSGYLFSTYAIW